MLKFTVSKPKIFTNLNKLANPKPIDYQIKEIKIVTIGDVLSSDESMIKDILSKELSKIPITMSDKISIPANAFDKTASKYSGSILLSEVQKQSSDQTVRLVGITNVDLISPPLNFVFSVAVRKGNALVMSFARLKDSGTNQANKTLERYKKVLLRALGFTFGFNSSPDRSCIMAFSNSLEELDNKGTAWCGNEEETIRKIQELK